MIWCTHQRWFFDVKKYVTAFALLAAALFQGETAQAMTPLEIREKALKTFYAHEYDHSASLCEMALRLNPGNHEALYLDARCYEELGQKERARALFQYLIAVFPGSESANLAKQALHDIDKSGPKQASAPPPKAPEHKPEVDKTAVTGIVDAKLAQGRTLNEAGRFNEAEHAYTDALWQAEKLGQLNPKLAEAVHSLGDFLSDRKDYQRAYPLFRRELSLKQSMYGNDARTVIDCKWSIVSTYVQFGDLLNAELFYRDCLEVFRKDYNAAVSAKKRVVNERNTLVAAMSGLSGVLHQEAGQKRTAEADDLDLNIKQLQTEDQQSLAPSLVNKQWLR
jgi:tetratricopeptide (TPR) repeat protein